MAEKKIVVHGRYIENDACRFHRLLLPFRFLQPRHPEFELACNCDPNPVGADAYLFHGAPDYVTVARIGRWKRNGAIVVWSMDDDFWSLPDWNGNKVDDIGLDHLAAVGDLADLILVSTPALGLAFAARGYGGKVCVAPNLMDLTLYPGDAVPEPEPGRPVRVMWAGSVTHARDLAVMAEGLYCALDALKPGLMEVCFLGAAPPHPILRDWLMRGVVWQQAVPFTGYWDALAAYSPHVWLAPMEDCPFNHSKSALRIGEGFALRAAVVASPVGEYKAAGDAASVLYSTTPAEWMDNVLRMVIPDTPARRHAVAAAGRERVERTMSWQNDACHAPWDEFLARVAGAVRAKRG